MNYTIVFSELKHSSFPPKRSLSGRKIPVKSVLQNKNSKDLAEFIFSFDVRSKIFTCDFFF